MGARDPRQSTVHGGADDGAVMLDTTGAPGYLGCVGRMLARATPLYLPGGEQSVAGVVVLDDQQQALVVALFIFRVVVFNGHGWDVPDRVSSQARRVCVQPRAGLMMMLEDPARFCRIVESLLYDGDCRSDA
jgi:hypothetical protein